MRHMQYDGGMKLFILIGMTVGGIIGGWQGSMLDKGSGIGLWSILLCTIGGVVGVWAGYKVYKNYGE